MSPAARLDVELAARGLARSRSDAASLIAAGVVSLNGRVASKAAQKVTVSDRIEVAEVGPRFASRAGHKLDGALQIFSAVVPQGKRCLDAGASTGGFTDVLLRAGARTVLAVDVGHDQLVPELRADPRVDVYEGLNIREITPEAVGGPVDLVVSDLSFISLRLVMAPLAGMCRSGADLVLMVKPQFEVGRSALPKGGVVRDPDQRCSAVTGVVAAAVQEGLEPRGLARSPLPGQDGNVEFFLWLRRPDGGTVTSGGELSGSGLTWVERQTVDWD